MNSELLAEFASYVNHQPQVIRDAAGQATSIAYNARGQVETITDPEARVTTFVYEENNTKPEFGRVKTVTAASNSALPATRPRTATTRRAGFPPSPIPRTIR